MSLAEPKRRRKNPMHNINLSAPNHWTNDDSKFGQKMLEKFGWTKGSGLGKNEQGISENIRVQHKMNPTGLGFTAHNADDWFKAGEEYSRLLSQLTEKVDEYQVLTEKKSDLTSKRSLIENSLNSRSRIHYNKFTKGKDLTQYKKEELTCILGKGVKDDDQNLSGLNMKEYFKTKRENKQKQVDTPDTSNIDSVDMTNDKINAKRNTETETSNTVQKKKKKLSKGTESLLSNDWNHTIELKKKKKSKISPVESVDNVDQPAIKDELNDISNNDKQPEKKKKKSKTFASVDIEQTEKKKESKPSKNENMDDSGCHDTNECNSNDSITVKEPKSELVLTHKYQNLVNLLIENSSAGKKYCQDSPSSLFEQKMKEFADNVKHQCATTVGSTEVKCTDGELLSNKTKVLNPDDKNFVQDFESQKSKALEIITKRQEVAKYVNEKSMFLAQYGDVLFFGSNINDIKGYGEW